MSTAAALIAILLLACNNLFVLDAFVLRVGSGIRLGCKISASSPSSRLFCSSSNSNTEYSNPLTKAVAAGFLKEPASTSGLDDINWNVKKRRKTSLKQLSAAFKKSYSTREWFVTGVTDPSFFADDFSFSDPDVALKGIENYSRGVNKLFDQKTTRGQIIKIIINEKETDEAPQNSLTVEWRLEGKVNIGPGVGIKAFVVYSDLTVNKDSGLIEFQKDRFSISSFDILLSALFPFLIDKVPFLSPPAPPLD